MTTLTPAQERYRAYLRSPHWQATRRRILDRAADHCEKCGRFCGDYPHGEDWPCGDVDGCEWCGFYLLRDGSNEVNGDLEHMSLEVHHLTYERLGAERDEDLQALCWSCHEGITEHEMDERAFRAFMRSQEGTR